MRTATGEEELISRAPTGSPGSADSREPMISADGRFVVFRSFAGDLVPGDSNGQEDIFVHDRYTGHTTLLSRSESGAQGNLLWTRPEISADGRFVAFTTYAAESAARTVSTDPASRWQVVASGDAGHPGLEWQGHAGVSYRVEHRDALNGPVTWTPVGNVMPGYGGILGAELPDTAGGGFFRVVAE